jgi:glutamate racemase
MDIRNNPIGIFDSGVGGLSVWKELVAMLPNESVIYFADTTNCPYGPRKQDEIEKLASNVVDFLISKNCKLIVVACNTATASAIEYLRLKYTVPFIGMEPAVKPAALNSKSKSIAVLATEGTFNGKLYNDTSNKYAKDVKVNIIVGDKLVEIVEKGLINEQETIDHIASLVKPLIEKEIDHLVLGCTHYPFLIDVLKAALPPHVNIVDPSPAIVIQTKKVLELNNIAKNENCKPEYDFYCSGSSSVLSSMLKEITDADYDINEL